jgi:hypothetical protein
VARKTADTDLYGTRSLGPGVEVRIRITKGSPIPPDLKNLEEAPPLKPVTDVVSERLNRTSEQRIDNMNVTELRTRLAARGLPTSGNKGELTKRLNEAEAAAKEPDLTTITTTETTVVEEQPAVRDRVGGAPPVGGGD